MSFFLNRAVRRLGLLGLLVTPLVTCQAQAVPANNECTTASPLTAFELGLMTVLGSTENASEDDLSICGENFVRAPGVWYSYETPETKDQIVQVSTCNKNTTYDTAITVLTPASDGDGTCSDLTCVDGRDDDSECGSSESHSTVSWRAEAGNTYYIQVHGSEPDDAGEFVLTITQEDPLDLVSDEGDAAVSTNLALPALGAILALALAQ